MTDTYELARAIYVSMFADGTEIVESQYEHLAKRAFVAAQAFVSVEKERAQAAASGKFKPGDPPKSFADPGRELG